VLSRAVQHAALKDAAVALPQVTDDILARVTDEARQERQRISEQDPAPVAAHGSTLDRT
jgi:hypothetical protein